MNLSNKEILEMILSANEEFSKNAQLMEQLASQIEQSNQRYLNELKRTQIRVDDSGVKQSIDIFRNVVENANKTIDRTQKKFNVTLYWIVFCAISLAALFFSFRFGFQAKSEIRNEFYNELNSKRRILSEKDAMFMQKFRKWADKNPNDSNDLFRKVEKMQVK